MSSEWERVRLGDVISLKGGLSYKGSFVGQGNTILVGMGAVSHSESFLLSGTKQYDGDFSESYRLLPGDIVIATRQQSEKLPILGYPARVPDKLKEKDVIVATNLWKVINNSEIDNSFLFWLLRSREYRERILSFSKGTTVRMITKEAVEDFWFSCPPPEQRNKITKTLDDFDNKIRLNREVNTTLEAISKIIFKSWFVDFEPVKTKMAARAAGGTAEDAEMAAIQTISGKSEAELDALRTKNPDKYNDLARTAALFPSAMVESELGEIPEGWDSRELDTIAENVRSSVKPSQMNPDGLYVGLEHIDRERLVLTRSGTAGAVESNKSCFEEGDILFGKLRPYFHKVCVAPAQGVCSTDILVIRPRDNTYSCFTKLLCFTEEFVNFTNLHSSGTRMPRASWKDMAKYKFPFPPSSLLEAFDQIVGPMLESEKSRASETKTLAALRDSLLPKLLSGELTHSGSEKQTPETANV